MRADGFKFVLRGFLVAIPTLIIDYFTINQAIPSSGGNIVQAAMVNPSLTFEIITVTYFILYFLSWFAWRSTHKGGN